MVWILGDGYFSGRRSIGKQHSKMVSIAFAIVIDKQIWFGVGLEVTLLEDKIARSLGPN